MPAVLTGEVVARYNSTRNAENIYEVKRDVEGGLWCTCPGCRFSKEQPKTCRHIKRVQQGLDDDSAVAEKTARRAALAGLMRGVSLDLADTTGGYYQVYNRQNAAREKLLDRLLGALDASGLFAPREQRPEAPRSRGVRLITLED